MILVFTMYCRIRKSSKILDAVVPVTFRREGCDVLDKNARIVIIFSCEIVHVSQTVADRESSSRASRPRRRLSRDSSAPDYFYCHSLSYGCTSIFMTRFLFFFFLSISMSTFQNALSKHTVID